MIEENIFVYFIIEFSIKNLYRLQIPKLIKKVNIMCKIKFERQLGLL